MYVCVGPENIHIHTKGVGVSEAKLLKWKLACVAGVKQERLGGREREGVRIRRVEECPQ